ncbi:hypothetical protein STHAL_32665 [Streptomyces halstedii]|uniref:Uncharacterized protein n=1 Tax=Streptomyces halstedii TaxID=1944 RepID=A0ABS6U0Y4_STRHA|nr:hypothetical protein [Streptomyces halstedii]MBV7674203.1 hypothetical protein [Streptomyces halstedii]
MKTSRTQTDKPDLPAATPEQGRISGPHRWLGSGLCAATLSVGALIDGYVVLTAYMIEPDGPWDAQAVTNSDVAGGVGLALSVLTALLAWLFVKAEWLRAWWYAVPLALAIAALLRLTLLAPAL